MIKRKFVKDYIVTDEMTEKSTKKVAKGESIELIYFDVDEKKKKILNAIFYILDRVTQERVDRVEATFTTATWADFWYCTVDAK